jgi:hypothetical protein
MNDNFELVKSHGKKLLESEMQLRDGFVQLEKKLMHATDGLHIYAISKETTLEYYSEYFEDDCKRGCLSFDGQNLLVKHRDTSEDDLEGSFNPVTGEPIFTSSPISLASVVWLRALAKDEVINSLFFNLAKEIEEQATETKKSVRVIDAALNYPALKLNSDFELVAKKLGYDQLVDDQKKAQAAVVVDPKDAVTRASCLIESVCQRILEEKRMPCQSNWSLKQKVNEALNALQICLDDKLLSKDVRKVFSGVRTIVDGVGYLRNSHSLAHGYGAKDVELDRLTARLAVNSSVVITTFLMETRLSDKTSDPHRI